MGSAPSRTSDTVGILRTETSESQTNVKYLRNAGNNNFEQKSESNEKELSNTGNNSFEQKSETDVNDIRNVGDNDFEPKRETNVNELRNTGDNNFESKSETNAFETDTSLDKSEIVTVKNETFKQLKKISEEIADVKIGTGQKITDYTFSRFEYVLDVFDCITSVTRLELQTFRDDVAEFMMKIKLFDNVASIIEDYEVRADFPEPVDTDTRLCYLSLSILFNYTDTSDAMADKVATTRVLTTCKKVLETYRKVHIEKTLSETGEEFLYHCHGIVHNVSKRDANIEPIRSLGFIKTLQPYMRSPKVHVKMACLATLANIVNEEECDIIKSHIRSVSRLLDAMENGFTEDDRCSEGWSCKECALAVRKLARNDANKQTLWILEAIPLLVELAEGGDEDEQLEAVLAIWSLAFDKQIREDVTTNGELKVVELLLKRTNTATENSELKKACDGCLWTLQEELKNSPFEQYREAAEEILRRQSSPAKEDNEGHIMISYLTVHRDIVMKIREKLIENNYKVRMDIDETGGGTLQSIADAIQNAAVVLLCYSRNYKESHYCRSEAEYAFSLNKPIVPVAMDQEYLPDGWLGLLLGFKYHVPFYGKNGFDSEFNTLLKEIKGAVQTSSAKSRSEQT